MNESGESFQPRREPTYRGSDGIHCVILSSLDALGLPRPQCDPTQSRNSLFESLTSASQAPVPTPLQSKSAHHTTARVPCTTGPDTKREYGETRLNVLVQGVLRTSAAVSGRMKRLLLWWADQMGHRNSRYLVRHQLDSPVFLLDRAGRSIRVRVRVRHRWLGTPLPLRRRPPRFRPRQGP